MTTKEHAEKFVREIALAHQKHIGYDKTKTGLNYTEILNKAQDESNFITVDSGLRKLIQQDLGPDFGYDLDAHAVKYKKNGEWCNLTRTEARQVVRPYIEALEIWVQGMEEVHAYLTEAVALIPENSAERKEQQNQLKKAHKNLTSIKRLKNKAGKGSAYTRTILSLNAWEARAFQ